MFAVLFSSTERSMGGREIPCRVPAGAEGEMIAFQFVVFDLIDVAASGLAGRVAAVSQSRPWATG